MLPGHTSYDGRRHGHQSLGSRDLAINNDAACANEHMQQQPTCIVSTFDVGEQRHLSSRGLTYYITGNTFTQLRDFWTFCTRREALLSLCIMIGAVGTMLHIVFLFRQWH